jgi:hypothetical protein
MSRQFARDYALEVPAGRVANMAGVNKFGRAEDGIQTTATDIWDRADSSATQQIWTAPTTARIHDITSTSIQDDGNPEGAGTGAQAVIVYGLTSWSAAEVNETVILNGTANVATSNSYVIIHRIKVTEVGSTYNINAGTITATAQTDGTVTAQINPGNGQTEMSIYGIPNTQTAYMTGYIINAHNTGNPSSVAETDFSLLVNERPDLNTATFLSKSNLGTIVTGTSIQPRKYNPYLSIAGPAIIKIQAITTLADTEGTAEYDLYLETNT